MNKIFLDFGKYNGEDIDEVPASYILWCSEQEWVQKNKPELMKYVKKHKKDLEKEAAEKRFSRK